MGRTDVTAATQRRRGVGFGRCAAALFAAVLLVPVASTAAAAAPSSRAASASGLPGSASVSGVPAAVAATGLPIQGASQATAQQLVDWFLARTRLTYRATVPVAQLAAYFIAEGRDQGIRGDVAFCQSVLETGWFSFPDGGQVRPGDNNFAGIGATDGSGGSTVAKFPTAQIGVRAQMQHLYAYASPTASVAGLAHPLVDPRFSLVQPPGKASTWNQLGNGNWATDPNYGTKILALYADLLEFTHVGAEEWTAAAYRSLLGRDVDPAGQRYWADVAVGQGRPHVTLLLVITGEATVQTVVRRYQTVLGTGPDLAGLFYWVDRLLHGTPVSALDAALYGSPAAVARAGGTTAYVDRLYRDLLGRPPDLGGGLYWTTQLTLGTSTPTQMAAALIATAEHRAEWVDQLYRRYLGRPADSGGKTYWAPSLAGGSEAALTVSLVSSTEYFLNAVGAA